MNNVKNISSKKRIIALDLFCGIGGLTKGLELAGISVAAGFDIDGSCSFIYEKNNNSQFVQCDLSKIEARALHEYYPANTDIKVLTGCAPCQPFSRLSGKYRINGYKDEKWKLLYVFSKFIQEELPDIISMENVPEIIKTEVYKDFVSVLNKNGYSVYDDIVFCPDYGVPQYRKRFVLLASKYGPISLIPPKFSFYNYLTVKDAIGNLPSINAGEQDPNDPMHRACKLSDINMKRIRQSTPGGTWQTWDNNLILKCHKRNTGKTYPSVYGRMRWDQPSPTITTQFYGYGNGRFGHPEQDRAISLREGALLQSFPPDYIFCDKDHPVCISEMGIHIGNAVPVELGRAIGESIQQHIQAIV